MPNIGDIVRANDFDELKPQISIGTVTTGEAGTDASATITGTSPNFKLNLTIPRGANGTNGTNGTSGIMFSQVFTSSTTVTVPTGATKAILSGRGGGGGNCMSGSAITISGGSGGIALNYPVNVSSGSSIKITIGNKGSNKTTGGYGSAGSGGVTSFGSLMSLGGGGGGYSGGGSSHAGSPGSGFVSGISGNIFNRYGTPGNNGILIVIWSR